MKNTNIKAAKGFKKVFVGMTAAVMAMTMFATVSASADNNKPVTQDTAIVMTAAAQYQGHDIIEGKYNKDNHDYDFKYSDGFFETAPKQYDTHMATASMAMAHASVTVINGDDYSHGADRITSVLEQEGFGDIFTTESYTEKPGTDTVACAIAKKTVQTADGEKQVVSVTVRSANYEQEWASNVTLGYDSLEPDAEAKGFAMSADKVMEHIKDYLKAQGLDKDENVVFWLQGYSRGAAVANLTAKRIIDEYDNAPVYAYCLGCPQGGTDAAEIEGKDYTSIHNVINIDDITTYVAPSSWGFKRYGVDHYLNDENFDSNDTHHSMLFGNNIADNDCNVWVSAERKKMVEKHVETLTDSPEEMKENLPVSIGDWRIRRDGVGIEIIPDSLKTTPSSRLNSFIYGLTRGISRGEYVGSGLEAALRRLMVFSNSGDGMLNTLGSIKFDEMSKFIKKECQYTILKNLYVINKPEQNFLQKYWDIITNSKDLKYRVDFNEDVKTAIANAAVKYLNNNPTALDQFKDYPGGSRQAVEDIRTIIFNVLKGANDLNNIVSIAKTGAALTHNHSFIQSLAWVRSYDSWYDLT